MMGTNSSWLDDIVEAFHELGGEAHYVDLYPVIEGIRGPRLTREWKASVRRTIEDHSSDSDNFRGEDIFQKLGLGHWALRNKNNILSVAQVLSGVTQEKVLLAIGSFDDELRGKPDWIDWQNSYKFAIEEEENTYPARRYPLRHDDLFSVLPQPRHQVNTFAGIGVPRLAEQHPEQRNADAGFTFQVQF